MTSRFQSLLEKGLLKTPPKALKNNIHYEVITGSTAYGVSQNDSDIDLIGFGIPPKEIIFPHLAGHIEGFNNPKNKFEQFQQHHIIDKSARAGKGVEYDITIYSIVKFFRLCMENNPNMVDTLFVPRNCVVHATEVGNLVRENRMLFLHKGSWHKFKGYAYSQLHKMQNKKLKVILDLEEHLEITDEQAHAVYSSIGSDDLPAVVEGIQTLDYIVLNEYLNKVRDLGQISKRRDSIKKHGYDVKFAYHVVRLLGEVEQILTTGDLNLQRDAELLKSIRRGEWSVEKITEYFDVQEKILEGVYASSELRNRPDEIAIQALLMNCLESHYGNLDDAVVTMGTSEKALKEIVEVMNKHNLV